jgi:protein disulfide-isomerase A6
LAPRSGTCVLALLPLTPESQAQTSELISGALTALAEVANKFAKRQVNIFPFYAVPADNEVAKTIRGDLGLKPDTELEIVAVNMKRGWWRRYNPETFDLTAIEGFIDAIKLGEGSKDRLPDGFFAEVAEGKTESGESGTAAESPEPVAAEPNHEVNEAQDSELPVAVPEPLPAEPEHDEL